MNRDDIDVMKDIAESFRELVQWTKFANIGKVKEVLESELNEPRKVLAYHLSDGKNTTRLISVRVGANKDTIAKWWGVWRGLGIAESVATKGGGTGAKKLFRLADFGIKIPTVTRKYAEPDEDKIDREEDKIDDE